MAAAGWDDDGVRTQRWYLIKNGIFQTYQTTRDQAHLIGEKESRGCSQADSYDGVPFQRMPNVILEPGQKPMSLDDLIAGVDDGVTGAGVTRSTSRPPPPRGSGRVSSPTEDLTLDAAANCFPVRRHSIAGVHRSASAFDFLCPGGVHVGVLLAVQAFNQVRGQLGPVLLCWS